MAIVQRIFSEPFRLAQDVLYRVGLIQLATNRFWLYFISHHIIIDGVGYANWFRSIFDAYQQLALGNTLKENTGVRFLDLAAQPLPENYSQQLAKAAKYWKELLHHLPDVPFQCRKEGFGIADSRKNSRLVHFIKPDRYKSFLTKASQCNLPISPLFITAIASLVNRINQSDGVLIGTPLHNRTTSAQRNMVGSFISMLPVMCVQNEQMSVAEYPERVAIRYQEQSLSFAEIDARANQIAQLLLTKGADNNPLVAILMEPGIDFVVSMLAILKAGCAYLPLDPTYSVARLSFILADSHVGLVIVDNKSIDKVNLPADSVCTILLDETEIAAQPRTEPMLTSSVTADSLAYVIYTSGSAGTPKGIKISHHNLLSYYQATQRCYPTNSAHVVLQIANIGFDIFIEELMLSVFSGGRLVLDNHKTAYSVKQLCQIIDAQKVTLISVPTALWHEWTYQLTADDVEQLVEHLKVCIVGGEAMRMELLALWQQKTQGKIRLFNTYGPTETTIVATAIDVTQLDTSTNSVVPIGRPLAHCQTYVLDFQGGLVPPNVIGELYIAGDALSLGYVNNPEQNAAQFVEMAILPEQTVRLYKTGDRVYWNNEGELVYVGRLDNQVKIRGFRIETREIESALSAIDGVATSIVRVTVDATSEKQLCAWLVMPEGTETDAVIPPIREQLKTRLPEYMVPTLYAVIATIPTTANGKVNFAALPEPKPCITRGLERVAETEIEKQLVQLCADALKLPSSMVSLAASFIELGGNSLTLLRFLHQIQQTFAVVVSIADVMTATNLAVLALMIERKQLQQTEQSHQGCNTVAEEGWL